MASYRPGLHLIGDADTENLTRLSNAELFKTLADELIASYGLSKVGEVYHEFPEAGYTATICLTESHISVHTWPEYGKVTFDVFLSNFKKNNDETTQAIFHAIAAFFEPTLLQSNSLRR